MLLYIISIIANIVYFVILRMDLYTDRYHLPDGGMGEHRRSPIDSMYTADAPVLVYLQIILMAVSVITSVILMAGVKNRVVSIVCIAANIASTVVFIIIMVVSGLFIHPHY